jgi:hypothetical protein
MEKNLGILSGIKTFDPQATARARNLPAISSVESAAKILQFFSGVPVSEL